MPKVHDGEALLKYRIPSSISRPCGWRPLLALPFCGLTLGGVMALGQGDWCKHRWAAGNCSCTSAGLLVLFGQEVTKGQLCTVVCLSR